MWGQIFNLENPLIGSENTWMLMAITCGWVAFSIYAEQTFKWASKISGAIVALIGSLAMTNLGIIPTSSVWFDDIVWGYVVPMAIPLLLMQCNMKKIWKESGRVLIIFLIGSIGTTCGAVVGAKLLGNFIPEMSGIAGMITGTYIGGGVNFAALAGAFEISGEMVSAATVADNLLMTLYFFVLITIPSIKFFRTKFKHPHLDEVENIGINEDSKTQSASFWDKKEISLKDIAINIAITVIIVTLSQNLANFLGNVIPTGNVFTQMMNALFGNQYLIITTVSMLVATFLSKSVANTAGSQEIGTYLIYLFFFVIGVPASIKAVITNAPMVLAFCAFVVLINMLFSFIFGKIFKFDLEEIILASNANIGGPTTAAAMAISKGWIKLVGPIMLVGVFGYVIGTYAGLFVGNLL